MTTNAIAWGMNWVKADTPLIAFSNVSSGNRQKKPDNTPIARTDVAGKRCRGCSRANKDKNCPSTAPAYSTREKPSNEVITHRLEGGGSVTDCKSCFRPEAGKMSPAPSGLQAVDGLNHLHGSLRLGSRSD